METLNTPIAASDRRDDDRVAEPKTGGFDNPGTGKGGKKDKDPEAEKKDGSRR